MKPPHKAELRNALADLADAARDTQGGVLAAAVEAADRLLARCRVRKLRPLSPPQPRPK